VKILPDIRALAAALPLFALVLAPAALAQGMGDAERGRELGFTCLGCHGIDGYRNAYPSYRVPKLDGQKGAYIEAALKAYRAGTRPHPTMQALAGTLSDEDIMDLIAWFTAGETSTDDVDAETPGLPEVAKTCVTCHGAAGTQATPAPPVLSGQHLSYLRHALGQYPAAARGQTVMNAFAAGLTAADMERIAQFYAARDGLATLAEHE
jgi:cytochrome c553